MITLSDHKLPEEQIQLLLRLRRAREPSLGRNLFSDPAWDVLLQLYAFHIRGCQVSVPELSLAIGTPESITARWITALQENGLVGCRQNKDQPSQLWVALTTAGAMKMKRFLEGSIEAFNLL